MTMHSTTLYRRFFIISLCIANVLFVFHTYFQIHENVFWNYKHFLAAFNCFFTLAFFLYYITMKKVMEETRNDYTFMVLQKTQRTKELEIQHIQKINSETQTQKADTLKQLNRLYTAIDQNDIKGVQNQLGDIHQHLKTFSPKYYCDYPLLNIIFHDKKTLAEAKGIHVEYNIVMPPEVTIPMTNLASIFFNLLDNAIEACEQSDIPAPSILLKTLFKGNMLSIHMVNSKNQHVNFNKKTTKSDFYSHGVGISIIEDIVKTHNGETEWNDLGDSFESILMLNIKS